MKWLTDLFGGEERQRLQREAEELRKQATDMAALAARLKEQLDASVPRADEVIENGVLTVTNWNAGYAAAKRAALPPDLVVGMTDEAVVKMWVDRRNLELEEPKLEVVHSDITVDGQVTLKLEWNTAFIRLLQARGFVGDSEDELVQAYLHQVTRKTDEEMFQQETADVPLAPPSEDDIEKILDNTNPETLKQLEKSIRRRAAQRGARQRTLDK